MTAGVVILSIIGGDMAQIELHGKYAVGEHRHAIVDDDDLVWLSDWNWRAKPNRNTVYAVRSSRVGMPGRKQRLVHMHREIIGLKSSDRREADHINHNGLDNRKTNLRPATRVQNQNNRAPVTRAGICRVCGESYKRVQLGGRAAKYCSSGCSALAFYSSTATDSGTKRAARLLSALSAPSKTVDIAERSGLHIVTVWRLLPQLVAAGKVLLVSRKPHVYVLAGAAA